MSENNKLNWLELNGVRYGLGKSIYAELDMSLERFVELLGRDFYCPTLLSAPTSSTVTYVDTDDDTHTFQIGQPCRWEEDGSWRLAVCLDNTGSASQWYVLPVKVSELTNDAGYLTEHQDISSLATKEELNKKVDKVVGKQLSTEDFTTLLKNKLDGLSNYDDTEINQAVSKLRADLDALVSGDTTTAIKTFNEVIAFLDGISDTEDLSGIIASIEQQIAAKQDVISDLATIRDGAAKGATAIQEHQDLSGKQDKLVSGANIKTINGQDILGEGDIVIEGNSEANVGAVDTDDFVEEPDLAKYLTTKPQSFTDEEKQQVKDNLGISAEDFDLSDYATKEELKGKEDKKVLIDHGTDDTTYALTPNVFHVWYDVASLSLTLAEPSDSTVYNEYMFEFISGQTATVLTLPDTVKWVSTPSIDPKKTYQVSIVNNIGLIAASEPTLMYFTIPLLGVKYYAKNGMTWEDFVNSEYNTNKIFTISILGVMYGRTRLVIRNNTPVNVTDKIGPFFEYHIQDGGN